MTTKTARNIAKDIQYSLKSTGQQLNAKTRRPVAPTTTQAYNVAGKLVALALVIAAVAMSQDYVVVALVSVLTAGINVLGLKLNRIENAVRFEDAKATLFSNGALAIKCEALRRELGMSKEQLDQIDEALVARLASE